MSYQFLGGMKRCSMSLEIDNTRNFISFPVKLASAVAFVTTRSLHHQNTESLQPLQCLKLSIYDWDATTSLTIEEVRIHYVPFLARHLLLTDNWNNVLSSFDSFCWRDSSYVSNVNHNGHKAGCKFRSNISLYSIDDNVARCQCDLHCSEFGDCCLDIDQVVQESLDGKEVGHSWKEMQSYTITCSSHQFPTQRHIGVGIFAISSCLERFKGSKLETQCNSIRDVLSHVPIGWNDLVFKNIFCLLCNGLGGNDLVEVIPRQVSFYSNAMGDCGRDITSVISGLAADDTYQYDLSGCNNAFGFAFPANESLLYGANRLGKLCFHHPENPNQIVTASAGENEEVFVLMERDHVRVVDDPKCLCERCYGEIFPYITPDMRVVANLFTENSKPLLYDDVDKLSAPLDIDNPEGLSNIFGLWSGPTLPTLPSLPAWNHTLTPSWPSESPTDDNVMDLDQFRLRMISLSGSGSSTALLLIIVVYMLRSKTRFSSAQRCQMGILIGKLVLFLAFLDRLPHLGTAPELVRTYCTSAISISSKFGVRPTLPGGKRGDSAVPTAWTQPRH